MEIFPESQIQVGNSSFVYKIEDLSCDGTSPSGPICPWPKPPESTLVKIETSSETVRTVVSADEQTKVLHDTVVKASLSKMAKGLFKSMEYAIKDGKVNPSIREERYDICKGCEHFIEATKRCSECGCFMEAKTWLGASPELLCPKNKWPR